MIKRRQFIAGPRRRGRWRRGGSGLATPMRHPVRVLCLDAYSTAEARRHLLLRLLIPFRRWHPRI